MKRIILFGLICFATVGCDKKEDAIPQAELNTTVISSQKQSAVRTSGDDLQVKLIAVNDSRCPSNAVCITAGSADVNFNVSDGTNETDVHVTFSSVNKNVSFQDFKLGGQTYSLTVTQVLPYPETSKTPTLEEYQVSVGIDKK